MFIIRSAVNVTASATLVWCDSSETLTPSSSSPLPSSSSTRICTVPTWSLRGRWGWKTLLRTSEVFCSTVSTTSVIFKWYCSAPNSYFLLKLCFGNIFWVFISQGSTGHIHPFIHLQALIQIWVAWVSNLSREGQTFVSPAMLSSSSGGDPEVLPGQLRYIVPAASLGSYPHPPCKTSTEHLTREVSTGHPNQMAKTPHLAPLHVEAPLWAPPRKSSFSPYL